MVLEHTLTLSSLLHVHVYTFYQAIKLVDQIHYHNN